tara:strand:+ start:1746 stop:2213 length:468 start_codon:yes stop_codon:yes gene_type:complete
LASHKFDNGNDNALRDYIKNNENSNFIYSAYRKMAHHYANTENLDKEIKTYNEMVLQFSDKPDALNSYAWRMAEIETNLEDALDKVRRAIMLTADNPKQQANIIDTEAEVLWKMKRYDDAIESINKAISIDPNSEYFKDQKIKFIDSKKGNDQPA